jgi:hypothetical protein
MFFGFILYRPDGIVSELLDSCDMFFAHLKLWGKFQKALALGVEIGQ